MPLRPARAVRRGVIGAPVVRTAAVVGTAAAVSRGPSPVAKTAAVVGTAAVVSHGIDRRRDRRTIGRR